MTEETKTVVHKFTPDEVEAEEQYLAHMAGEGWHLLEVKPSRCRFRRGAPGEYTYRLDLREAPPEDLENYVQMFRDAGWEPVCHFGNMFGFWYYFRRSGREEKFDSDDKSDSRLERLYRVRRALIRVTALCVGLVFLAVFTSASVWGRALGSERLSSFLLGLLSGLGVVTVLVMFMLVSVSRRIRREEENRL